MEKAQEPVGEAVAACRAQAQLRSYDRGAARTGGPGRKLEALVRRLGTLPPR